jgi:predicted nuclease with TOPRIM domain
MRDIVTTANFERADMQQQYEQCREEYQRLQAENDKLVTELTQSYDEVAGLHEQLDDAMGSSRMVEYLTERNLDLEDKLR